MGQPADWAVVNAQPHRERVALENLLRQEFRAYCPMIRRRRRHGRQVTDVLRPLFPGYLFVQVSPNTQGWRPMLSTLGVRSLLRCGDRLSLIEDAFVQSLKEREIAGVIARPASPYCVGEQVRLAGGAFDGLLATIIDMNERNRVVVLINLLNRSVRMTVGEHQLSPV